MPHIREQVRTAAAALVTGLATTGSRVYVARDLSSYPLQPAELPGLLVEVVDEAVQQTGIGGAGTPLVCEALLRISALAKSVAGAVDTVDDACAEVQAAVMTSGRIGGAVVLGYVGTQGPGIDAGTERPVARAVMTFAVRYVMARSDATVAL